MDHDVCSQCGQDFEGKGIQRHGEVFCSEECCDDFEMDLKSDLEPDLDDLDDEDLGYRKDEFDDELDDDFESSLGDF